MSNETTVDAAAVTDGAWTLFVADFGDTDSAWQAYEVIKDAEDGRTLSVEGVLVVQRDDDGKLQILKATDHSTRRGLGWGVVGGVVVGLIFPPTILGSVAALGAIGAATGKGVQLHHRKELVEDLQDAVPAGHSGIVALVSDPQAEKLRKALDKADAIAEKALDKAAAEEIKAAAEEAAAETSS